MAKGLQPAANAAQATIQTPPAPAAKQAPAKRGAVDLPPGWTDTIAERQWEGNDTSLFGARSFEAMNEGSPVSAGFVPGESRELAPGERAPDVDETIKEALAEAEAAAKAKPKAGKAKADAAEGDAKETEAQEAPADGEEATEETAEAATEGETETEAKEETETEKPAKPESSAMVRRRALAALKLEAEKRDLEQRLKAEQEARAADQRTFQERSQDRQAALEALRKAPLAERLKAMGIDSQEAVQEAFLRGELKDLPEQAPAAPSVDADRVARLENEVAIAKRDASIQAILLREKSSASVDQVIAEATRTWTAAGNKPEEGVAHINRALATIIESEKATGSALAAISAEVDKVDAYPAPFTRATPGAIDAAKQVALTHWRSAGAKPGDFPRFVKFAIEAAEDMYRERYEPLRSVFGAPAAPAKPSVKAPVKKAPAPPIGTRVAAAAAPTDDDDGPMDPALRDRWVKEQMRKKGHVGW